MVVYNMHQYTGTLLRSIFLSAIEELTTIKWKRNEASQWKRQLEFFGYQRLTTTWKTLPLIRPFVT